MEKTNVIVGSSFAGLLLAKHFLNKGTPFLGIEKEETIGQNVTLEPLTTQIEETRKALSTLIPEGDWISETLLDFQRTKGEWKDIGTQKPSLFPIKNWGTWLHEWTAEVAPHYKTLRWISQIFPDEKKLVFQDHSELFYDKLYWCESLHKLSFVYKGDIAKLENLKHQDHEGFSAFRVLIELQKNFTPENYQIHFPFRFKDHKLTAIGFLSRSTDKKALLDWSCQIPREFEEDQEEVAKCFKTFRRELFKEFADIEAAFISEKFIYIPKNPCVAAKSVSSLEVMPDIFYLGSEITPLENPKSAGNIDIFAQNFQSVISC